MDNTCDNLESLTIKVDKYCSLFSSLQTMFRCQQYDEISIRVDTSSYSGMCPPVNPDDWCMDIVLNSDITEVLTPVKWEFDSLKFHEGIIDNILIKIYGTVEELVLFRLLCPAPIVNGGQ